MCSSVIVKLSASMSMVREPRSGRATDPQDVAFAFGIYIVAGRHVFQQLRRIRGAGMVPDRPQRSVFEPSRHSAKVLRPICRAARNSFRAVTPSRNHTW